MVTMVNSPLRRGARRAPLTCPSAPKYATTERQGRRFTMHSLDVGATIGCPQSWFLIALLFIRRILKLRARNARPYNPNHVMR